jgi:hypothetical protein
MINCFDKNKDQNQGSVKRVIKTGRHNTKDKKSTGLPEFWKPFYRGLVAV